MFSDKFPLSNESITEELQSRFPCQEKEGGRGLRSKLKLPPSEVKNMKQSRNLHCLSFINFLQVNKNVGMYFCHHKKAFCKIKRCKGKLFEKDVEIKCFNLSMKCQNEEFSVFICLCS